LYSPLFLVTFYSNIGKGQSQENYGGAGGAKSHYSVWINKGATLNRGDCFSFKLSAP